MPRILDQEIDNNPFDTASNLMEQAAGVYSQAAGGNVPTTMQSMNQYLNPYYDSVIADVTRNMQRNMRQGLNMIGDDAQAAGAFGSGRHGLQEAMFMGEANRNIGDMTNNMLMQRFNTAAQLGAGDANRQLSGMFTGAAGLNQLAGNYYNIGNDITDRQAAAGGQQQNLLQQILSQGSGQFDAYTRSPTDAMQIMMAALAADPRQGNTVGYGRQNNSSSSNPGTLGILGGLAQLAGVMPAGLFGFGAGAAAGAAG